LEWSWLRHGLANDEPEVDVVLIHGFQNDHSAWNPLVSGLERGDWRLTAVDLPGCGQSQAPDTWERSTIEQLALDIAELIRLESLHDPVLVGHSMGAAIALQVALDEPDVPSGLVLFSPASTRGFDFMSSEAIEALGHQSPDDRLALLRAAFYAAPDPELLAALEQVVLRAHPLHVEGAARSMGDFSIEGRLGEITAPTLIIAGDRDRHVPLRNHFATWSHLHRAGLHVGHNVGHVPFVEDPATSAELVERFIVHERRRQPVS
jgi:sigma-B regulation protein RsbQ